MSALTTIFNHLYVYLYAVMKYIFGGECLANDFNSEAHKEILIEMGEFFYNYYPDLVSFDSKGVLVVDFAPQPILILIVGVFALGAIIALVRRLVR